MKLVLYKFLSLLLLIDLIAVILFVTTGNNQGIILAAVLFFIILGTQVALIKCSNCGTRPGLWLLAIWTLLLDFDLYVADTILLRECPNCKNSLKEG